MTAPVPAPAKKRNTHHWKAIAKAAERLAGDRLTMLEAMSDTILAERKALFAAEQVTARYRVACYGLATLLALALAFCARLVGA